MEKVYFNNSKGDRLCGVISNPASDKSRPIVIMAHGFSTSKNSDTYVSLSKNLDSHKISSFRFDFYGHGESEGKFEDVTVSEAVDDILQAIKYLKKALNELNTYFPKNSPRITKINSKLQNIECL